MNLSSPFRFNFLCLRGTALPHELLLIVRVLAFALIFLGEEPSGRHVPYFRFLDAMGSPALYDLTLLGIADAGFLLLLFSGYARLGCFLTGGAFLMGLLSCRGCLSVAHTYVACVFLIVSMSSRRSGTWLLKMQVVILYAGSALNKGLDLDWWNGRAFEALLVLRHHSDSYAWVSSWLPPMSLSTTLGMATVMIQAALAVCFLVPRWYTFGIVLGVGFHGVMVIFLNSTFGPFFLASMLSNLAFVDWPKGMVVTIGASAWHGLLRETLRITNFNYMVHFASTDRDGTYRDDSMEIEVDGRRIRGFAALQRLLFFNPILFFMVALFFTDPYPPDSLRNGLIILLVVFFSPLPGRVVGGAPH